MFNGLRVIGNKMTVNRLLHLSLHFLHIDSTTRYADNHNLLILVNETHFGLNLHNLAIDIRIC